jgi:ribosome-associated toxin RatA of RatAB toxin-antitoxin module
MGLHWAENEIVIAATPDQCFEAITDYETFPDWQSAVYETEVTQRDNSTKLGEVVRFVVDGKVRKIRYTLRYHYDRPDRIWWDFMDGQGIKRLEGEYTFAPSSEGTLATYKVGIDPGGGVPGPVAKRVNKQTIKKANEDLKAETERRASAGGSDSEPADADDGEAPRSSAPRPRPTAREAEEDQSPIPFGVLPEPLDELAKLPGKVLVRIGRLLGG